MKTKKIQVTVKAGKSYGHVPGHHYHDVEVSIERKTNGRWMVDILETWGSNQGYDEEQGKRQVIGRDATLDAAVERAERLAMAAGIEKSFLAQSLSQAASEAEEAAEANQESQ
jgi:hypothetical protein